ncbi:MAG TPA: DinB family protein [Chryseolinea sp.]|nr:DinB family protein [Chryseolinea sp.]
MKKTKTLLFLFFGIASITAMVSFRQADPGAITTDDMKQMVANWERAKIYTQEYLNASTDDVVNFKPTPEMRTFGQQMLHLAEVNYAMASGATGKPTTVSFGSLEKSDQLKTKAAVTKAVMDSYDFVIAATKEMTEAKMGEPVKIFNFDMSRAVALDKLFEHQTHHRGQTTVYLRLKGIVPPNEKLF